jgi:hypothetical protein
MRIFVIKGASSYDVLTRFSDHAAAGFAELGHEVEIFDGRTASSNPLTFSRIKEDFDLALGFNAMCADFHVTTNGENRYCFDAIELPVVSWMVDHPCYHYPTLTPPIARRLTLCANPEHAEFVAQTGIAGEQHTLLAAAMGEVIAPVPFQERRFEAVLAATWMGEPTSFWEPQCSPEVVALFERALDLLIHDFKVSPWQALNTACMEKSASVTSGENHYGVLAQMLYFVRRYDRIRLVRTLAESGLPVTVIGSGWDNYAGPKGNLRFMPDQSTDAMIQIYRNSKVVFNLNAANGASERAFTGMLSGAAVLSDFGQSLAAAAAHGEEILFYDRTKPDDVSKKLGQLLESDDGEKIASLGREKTLQEHLWKHRAQAIIDYVSQSELLSPTCLEGA